MKIEIKKQIGNNLNIRKKIKIRIKKRKTR